jgi:hypothetical protein
LNGKDADEDDFSAVLEDLEGAIDGGELPARSSKPRKASGKAPQRRKAKVSGETLSLWL